MENFPRFDWRDQIPCLMKNLIILHKCSLMKILKILPYMLPGNSTYFCEKMSSISM